MALQVVSLEAARLAAVGAVTVDAAVVDGERWRAAGVCGDGGGCHAGIGSIVEGGVACIRCCSELYATTSGWSSGDGEE